MLLRWFFDSDKSAYVKANGLIREAKWTSEGDGKISWAQAYERRMRILNVEIILAALIILTGRAVIHRLGSLSGEPVLVLEKTGPGIAETSKRQARPCRIY